jgi:hypothetical protein
VCKLMVDLLKKTPALDLEMTFAGSTGLLLIIAQ